MKTAVELIKEEYDRCIHLAVYPDKSPPIYGIEGRGALMNYYSHRAEALGFALDKLKQEEREKS